MVYAPDELIDPILLRLPVKSLLRFSSVSKSWFSIISDPRFATLHFERGARRILYLPVTAYDSQARSINLDTSSLHTAALNPSFLPPNSFSGVKGSCRGFVLLSHYNNTSSNTSLHLWNPSTRVHKSLPSSSNEYINFHTFLYGLPLSSNDFHTFLYGFGYDSSTDDYLVIIALSSGRFDSEVYFELFSLKANAWETIEAEGIKFDSWFFPYMTISDYARTGTLFNGVIHWLAMRYDVPGKLIMAFDLMERSLLEVPLPTADFKPYFKYSNLCVLGGFLSLCVARDDATEIWVMQEYNVQSSWTMSVVVRHDDLPMSILLHHDNLIPNYFFPICSTTSDGIIIGLDHKKTGLVKCNAGGQLLHHLSYCDDPSGCEVTMYRESLFSLSIDNVHATLDDHH